VIFLSRKLPSMVGRGLSSLFGWAGLLSLSSPFRYCICAGLIGYCCWDICNLFGLVGW